MMNKMNIALDYDNTYTLDSDLWDVFIKLLAMRGHTVYIVTMRYVTQPIEPILDLVPGNVHYTSGKAKRKFSVRPIKLGRVSLVFKSQYIAQMMVLNNAKATPDAFENSNAPICPRVAM